MAHEKANNKWFTVAKLSNGNSEAIKREEETRGIKSIIVISAIPLSDGFFFIGRTRTYTTTPV